MLEKRLTFALGILLAAGLFSGPLACRPAGTPAAQSPEVLSLRKQAI